MQRLDRLLQLCLCGVELCVRRVERRLRILELERALLLFERERVQRLTQTLELVGTRQDAAALGGAPPVSEPPALTSCPSSVTMR